MSPTVYAHKRVCMSRWYSCRSQTFYYWQMVCVSSYRLCFFVVLAVCLVHDCIRFLQYAMTININETCINQHCIQIHQQKLFPLYCTFHTPHVYIYVNKDWIPTEIYRLSWLRFCSMMEPLNWPTLVFVLKYGEALGVHPFCLLFTYGIFW
jgi:hypothetical protein